MRIRYTDFCLNPALRNTTTNLPQHRAIALIDSGAAVEVPFSDFRERLASEEESKPLPTAAVTWAVTQGAMNGRYAITARCSQAQCSTLFYEGPPAGPENLQFLHSCGCGFPENVPAAIAEQYFRLHKPVTKYGDDEALALSLGAPQKSKPVDLSGIVGLKVGDGREKPGPSEQDMLSDFLPTISTVRNPFPREKGRLEK